MFEVHSTTSRDIASSPLAHLCPQPCPPAILATCIGEGHHCTMHNNSLQVAILS